MNYNKDNQEKDFLKRYESWGFPQKPHDVRIKYSFRVNTNRIDSKLLIKRLEAKGVSCEKIPFLDFGYYYKSKFSISASVDYLLGNLYPQEAPAQVPAQVINQDILDSFGDSLDCVKVLDMCAAPGGKTTQLCEGLKNKGEILAIENSEKRAKKMFYNCERMHATNCSAKICDAEELGAKFEEYFDYVLLDAPCSGNFSGDESWFERREIKDFKNRSRLQKRLIDSAFKYLKKGGILVYSTCSLEMEENEEVIEYALESFDFELIPINLNAGSSGLTSKTKDCVRFWPTQHNQPGFFVAKLQKK